MLQHRWKVFKITSNHFKIVSSVTKSFWNCFNSFWLAARTCRCYCLTAIWGASKIFAWCKELLELSGCLIVNNWNIILCPFYVHLRLRKLENHLCASYQLLFQQFYANQNSIVVFHSRVSRKSSCKDISERNRSLVAYAIETILAYSSKLKNFSYLSIFQKKSCHDIVSWHHITTLCVSLFFLSYSPI